MLNVEEPASYREATNSKEWKKAMANEVESIEKNKTWVLTDLPEGHKAIDFKWVYKLKRDTERKIQKYKARLVVKGYVQRYGIDYEEVFAPVTRLEK